MKFKYLLLFLPLSAFAQTQVPDSTISETGVTQHQAAIRITSSQITDTVPGAGTVTSVAVSGSDGLEVDSGSPITGAGTIALGLNKATTLTFLNVEDGATADQTQADIEALGFVTGAHTVDTNTQLDKAGVEALAIDIVEAQITDLSHTNNAILGLASSGIRSGGLVTINADDTKFDVSAGSGWIVVHSATLPTTITAVTWTAFTAQTVTNLATSFATDIAINSSGAIVQQDSFTDIELRSLILLGGIDHSNQTSILNTFPIQRPTNSVASNVSELAIAVGDINLSGNNYGENGANLSIDKSAGLVYSYGRNNGVDSDNPSKLTTAAQTALEFGYVYDNGSGVGKFVSPTAFIDPDRYDDGSGTLATVGNNKFTIKRILYFPNSNNTFIQYGTAVYNSFTDALDAVPRANFTSLEGIKTAMVRGYIVVQEGETTLASANTAFLSASKFGNVAGLEAGSTTATWGNIVGTLADQTDLQAALDSVGVDWTATQTSAKADGASNVAFDFDTDNAFSLGKIASWSNNGAEVFSISDTEANLSGVSGTVLTLEGYQLGTSNAAFQLYNAGGTFLKADNTEITLGRSGMSKTVLSFVSTGTHTFHVKDSQDPTSLVIRSADGTADYSASELILRGGLVDSANLTNIVGGNVTIDGGKGSSASAGLAHGGDVVLSGGTGYGTGHDGYIIMTNLPTSDPSVTGALWNDSGTLKISL